MSTKWFDVVDPPSLAPQQRSLVLITFIEVVIKSEKSLPRKAVSICGSR